MAPIEIKRPEKHLLFAKWQDGFEATIQVKKFREDCPCADCRENREKKLDNPLMINVIKPGINDLVDLQPVGNYAVAAEWGDGHNTGIYSWNIVRDIFEKHKLTDVQIEALNKTNAKGNNIPKLNNKDN